MVRHLSKGLVYALFQVGERTRMGPQLLKPGLRFGVQMP
jgi:hypothetical protein